MSGRTPKLTVEYFPHYIGDGKKIFTIESKYGNDGYATWNKILELLAKTANHFLDLSEKSELMFVSSYCKISESMLFDIMTDLCHLQEIDAELWGQQIIWNQRFVDSIQYAYAKRTNPCVTRNDIIDILTKRGKINTVKSDKKPKKDEKPAQIEKTKPFDFKAALIDAGATKENAHGWTTVRARTKAVNTEIAFKGFMREVNLTELSINDVLLKCIESSWRGFQAAWINGNGPKNKTTHNNSGDKTDWDKEIKDANG